MSTAVWYRVKKKAAQKQIRSLEDFMIFASIRNLTIGIVIFVCLGYLFQQSKLVNINEHDRYINALRKLQQLDISINENVLKARHLYTINYDPLVNNLSQMKKTNLLLADIPSFVSEDGQDKINALYTDYINLLTEKEAATNRFKSENSILRNSLTFFPIAATELAAKVSSHDKDLAVLLQSLVRDILLYNLYSNQELLSGITLDIANVRSNLGSYVEFLDPEDLERIIHHGDTILKYKSSRDQQDRSILELPTRLQLEDIYNVYYNEYVRSLNAVNKYRLLLYLATILLVAFLAHTFMRLTNTQKALQLANVNLEQRVAKRTVELNTANTTLKTQNDQLGEYILKIRAAHEELQRVSITDELTGLFTRRFLFEWMEKEVETRFRNPGGYCCLLIDIDLFKGINDTYGHQEGDKALVAVANAAKQVVRQADIVGRYGGEEFLILLPNTSFDNAHLIAEKVRKQIEHEVKKPRQITVSIGVGGCVHTDQVKGDHNTSETISLVLEIADQALYKAKAEGRNRVVMGTKIIKISGF